MKIVFNDEYTFELEQPEVEKLNWILDNLENRISTLAMCGCAEKWPLPRGTRPKKVTFEREEGKS